VIPQWVRDLVSAQRDYERAKAKRDEAMALCDACERRLDEITRDKAKWQQEQMALALASLERSEEFARRGK
jgi:phage shock protein A